MKVMMASAVGDPPVHRQEDAEEELELVGAVDDGGFAEIARDGIEELLVDDHDHRVRSAAAG